MRDMFRRIVSTVVVICVCLALISTQAIATTFPDQTDEEPTYFTGASTTSELSERLNALMAKHVNTFWTTTGESCGIEHNGVCWSKCYHGHQCKGFASYIFNELFCGGYIGAYNPTTYYYIGEPCAATLVGISAGFSSDDTATVRNILSKGQPGDFIQTRRRGEDYGHSMILVSVDNDGVWLFDCNSGTYRCGVRKYYQDWATFAKKNEAMSLYHSTKYPTATDTAAPTLSNIKISAVGPTGYTVSVVSTDDVAVDRVQFPTWTSTGGKDDMIQDWQTNPAASGAKNGDTYTYRVSVGDHNWEYGTYTTCICTYDTSGKWISQNVSVNLTAPDRAQFGEEYGDDFYACIQNSGTNTVLTHDLTGFGNGDYDAVFHSYVQSNMQYWHFTRNDDNSWQISPASDESLALHVVAGSGESGARVILHKADKSYAQSWIICEVDGYWTLRPQTAADCYLDVPGGNAGDGVSAWVYEYNGATMQKFIISKAETCRTTRNELGSDFYAYIENAGVGTVMTRDPDGFGNGDYDAIFTGYANEDTQIWHFVLNDNGTYRISPKSNENLSLHMYAGLGTSGTSVLLHESKDYLSQQWYISKYDGAYILRPAISSNCYLDVPDGSAEWGVSARIWSFNGSPAQKYNIVKVDDSIDAVAEGTYDGRTYRVYDENMTWTEAQKFCESMGGSLVSITSQEEQDFVAGLIAGSGSMNMYWIGANAERGTYVWSDGEPWSYTNWDVHEPSNSEGNEMYGQIYNVPNPRVSGSQRFKWNDAVESNQREWREDFFGLHHVGFILEYSKCKGNHKWDNGTVTEEASCTEDGTRRFACTECGAAREETIPASGHDYSETVTDPTCTEQGYTTLTCGNCGDSKLKATVADITEEFTWTDGMGILATTGEEQASNNWMASDYVDISCASEVKILTANTIWAGTNVGLAFYDVDKNYISGVAHTDGSGVYGVLTRVLEVPENAVYIRSTWYSVNHPNYDSSWGGFSCEAAITKVSALGHDLGSWTEIPTWDEKRECLRCDYAETRAMTSVIATVEGVEYCSLNAAIEAAARINGTVTLQADAAITSVFIPNGVTLDLAEFTLTAEYLFGVKGSCLTAAPNAGKLMVEKENLILAEQGYKNASGQYILPIWDPGQNCYLFSLFVVNTNNAERGLFIDEENETIRFQFKHQATGDINKGLLGDGSSDNALKVIVRLVWSTGDGEAYQDFVYNDGFVKKVAVGENGVSYDYSFTLTGYSAMNIKLDTLTVTAMIITDSGAVASGTEWTAETAK